MALENEPLRALDPIDMRIVSELIRDGRLPIRALAEKVHISRSQAYARLQRLHATNVIKGYSARISPDEIGLGTSAFIALWIKQDALDVVSEKLRTLNYVDRFFLLSGNFEVLVLVRAPSQSILRDIIIDDLKNVSGVESTRTWFIFGEDDGPGFGSLESTET